ncbi:MAG: hypothetical protein IJC74_07370 [Clostridia bacterium]|nr:hypothetical protein [Clostridia bacterium]
MGYVIFGTIIGGIIWGIVVNKVIENKGYEENWFWWGFFFGIFALIIALTKQSVNTTKVVIESSAQIKENMEQLSSCILNNQVNISSPVHITSWEIKKDVEKIVLFVNFINVSQRAISAVMFSATGFNSFGDRVQMNDADSFDVIGQDLSVKPNEYEKIYTVLPNDAIRKVEVKVKKICFADGTVVDDIQDEWIDANQSKLESIHIDCARRENTESKFYAIIKERYWQCVCGFVNSQNTCSICGMQKNSALKFTKENFANTYIEYLNRIESERLDEERRRLEEKGIAELRLIRIKKIAAVIMSCIVTCITITLVVNYVMIPNYKYEKAIAYLNNKKYDDAINIFIDLKEFKNSKDMVMETKHQKNYEGLKNCKVGEYVAFGAYEQDNNLQNGNEEIDWLVLEKQDDLIFVISKYAIDCQPYNAVYANVTWETCSLRKWLNSEFINNAFSNAEKEMIFKVKVPEDNNSEYNTVYGKSTEDYIYIASVDEVYKYLDLEKIKCQPTAYTANKGAQANKYNGNCMWWLRTPGSYQFSVSCVYNDGHVYRSGHQVHYDEFAVRPVMWIKINGEG